MEIAFKWQRAPWFYENKMQTYICQDCFLVSIEQVGHFMRVHKLPLIHRLGENELNWFNVDEIF